MILSTPKACRTSSVSSRSQAVLRDSVNVQVLRTYADEINNTYNYVDKIRQKLYFYNISHKQKEFNKQLNITRWRPKYKTIPGQFVN